MEDCAITRMKIRSRKLRAFQDFDKIENALYRLETEKSFRLEFLQQLLRVYTTKNKNGYSTVNKWLCIVIEKWIVDTNPRIVLDTAFPEYKGYNFYSGIPGIKEKALGESFDRFSLCSDNELVMIRIYILKEKIQSIKNKRIKL